MILPVFLFTSMSATTAGIRAGEAADRDAAAGDDVAAAEVRGRHPRLPLRRLGDRVEHAAASGAASVGLAMFCEPERDRVQLASYASSSIICSVANSDCGACGARRYDALEEAVLHRHALADDAPVRDRVERAARVVVSARPGRGRRRERQARAAAGRARRPASSRAATTRSRSATILPFASIAGRGCRSAGAGP